MTPVNGSLRILLTNLFLDQRTGSEIVTRDFAIALATRGHRVQVYSPVLGVISDELKAAGILATDEPGALDVPDVIHGQHHPPLMLMLARFSGVPALMYLHDRSTAYDEPPGHPRILRYLAVDNLVRQRLTPDMVDPTRVRVVLNGVPLERFPPRTPLPERPARALAYTKHAAHLPALRAACGRLGLPLDEMGLGVGRFHADPGRLLAGYDLVFSSARSALEAMAVGTAVIVCDGRGLAGMVTPENFAAWRVLNFGLGTLTRPVTEGDVHAEILRYASSAAAKVRRFVRRDASLEVQVDALEAAYRAVIQEWRAGRPPTAEVERDAWIAYLRRWLPNPRLRHPWDDQLTEEQMWKTGKYDDILRLRAEVARGAEEIGRLGEALRLAGEQCHRLEAERVAELRAVHAIKAERAAETQAVRAVLVEREAELRAVHATQAERAAETQAVRAVLVEREAELSALRNSRPVRLAGKLRRWPWLLFLARGTFDALRLAYRQVDALGAASHRALAGLRRPSRAPENARETGNVPDVRV